MLVTVVFLASYREKAGNNNGEDSVGSRIYRRELIAQVCAQFPGLPDADRIVAAVNNDYREP